MIVALMLCESVTAVGCKHTQSHDTCWLVFPLGAWLYSNKCVDVFYSLFASFSLSSVLLNVLWKFKCTNMSYCSFLCLIKTCSSPVFANLRWWRFYWINIHNTWALHNTWHINEELTCTRFTNKWSCRQNHSNSKNRLNKQSEKGQTSDSFLITPPPHTLCITNARFYYFFKEMVLSMPTETK